MYKCDVGEFGSDIGFVNVYLHTPPLPPPIVTAASYLLRIIVCGFVVNDLVCLLSRPVIDGVAV